MKDNVYNAHEKVLQILREEPETRSSDALLAIRYFERQLGQELPEMRKVLLDKQTPTTETIRRCRQKIQSEHLELHGDRKVRIKRGELEEVYREYAKGAGHEGSANIL